MRLLRIVSRPENARVLHLAERRELKFTSGESLRTPLLVPSFSSRIADVEKPLSASREFIDGPFLISAYDIARGHLDGPFDFAGAVFLDSGGYEVGPGSDLSDVSSVPSGEPEDWSAEQHSAVLAAWSANVPTVVISYDHPHIRIPVSEQISRCRKLALPPNAARELLLKPETNRQNFIQMDAVAAKVQHLHHFQAVGVTEKEIGNSVLDRMRNIARLRRELKRVHLDLPIHVFGSLDTVTTLFYFIAGADIFDGLTWLRYAFSEGHTIYRQDYGISAFGVDTKTPKVEALCWSKNYSYLCEMQLEMRRFLINHDFNAFKYHKELLKAAFENVIEEVMT